MKIEVKEINESDLRGAIMGSSPIITKVKICAPFVHIQHNPVDCKSSYYAASVSYDSVCITTNGRFSIDIHEEINRAIKITIEALNVGVKWEFN